MNYTVVVVLQRIRGENESTTVVESQELDRFRAQVQANETWQNTYEVTPPISGDQLRLAFLLYRESPPASPRIENVYREIHLRVNVSA